MQRHGEAEVTSLDPRDLRVDEPQVGHYRTRLVRGGPWCAVRIFWLDPDNRDTLDRAHKVGCTVNGEPADPYAVWTYCAGSPISEAEYRYLRAVASTPGQPEATPRRAIDPLRSPITF